MKAQLWKIRVSQSVMDMIHGGFFDINEIFIPELRFVINDHGQFFLDEKYDRYKDSADTPEVPEMERIDSNHQKPELLEEVELTEEMTAMVSLLAAHVRAKDFIVKCVYCQFDAYNEDEAEAEETTSD